MAGLMENYGTEDKCHAALVASRWSTGFVCPKCGGTHHSTFERKGLHLLAVFDVPRTDRCNLRDDFPRHEAATDTLIFGYAAVESIEEQHIGAGHLEEALQDRLAVETQADANHDGAGRIAPARRSR